jgi:hypothetical protein
MWREHDLRGYLVQVNAMQRVFAALAAADDRQAYQRARRNFGTAAHVAAQYSLILAVSGGL